MSNVIHVDFRKAAPPPAAADDWPASHGALHLVVRTGPDQLGCQNFDALWRDTDGSKRCEAFVREPLAQVRAQMREHGLEVEVVDRVGCPLSRAL